MIEKIDSFQKLDAFKDKNIFTVRIKSLAYVYGFGFSFASFYRQIINNETAAVFSVLDSDITLAVDANCADFDELAEFFMLRGFTSLMCSDDFIIDGEYDHGQIMECRCKFDLTDFQEAVGISTFEQLSGLYEFLDYGGSFDAWYADIRRRLNLFSAKACGIYRNEKIVTSAVLSSIYKSDAVLTGVKTDEKYRRQGFAGEAVKYLCNCVPGSVYLMREDGKNENFYSEIGFKNIERWRMYR